jgi:hypothetical protein
MSRIALASSPTTTAPSSPYQLVELRRRAEAIPLGDQIRGKVGLQPRDIWRGSSGVECNAATDARSSQSAILRALG